MVDEQVRDLKARNPAVPRKECGGEFAICTRRPDGSGLIDVQACVY